MHSTNRLISDLASEAAGSGAMPGCKMVMYSNVIRASVCLMAQKTAVVTLRLSAKDRRRIRTVQSLTDLDRASLLREFIEDGLRERVIQAYRNGKITSQRAAEILDIPLRTFLSLLEERRVEINWDNTQLRSYMRKNYGE